MTSKEKKRVYDRLYHKTHSKKRVYSPEVLAKRHVNNRAWRAKNREHIRQYEFLKKYGITTAERDAMLVIQGGLCKICTKKLTVASKNKGDWPHTDHSKITGKVRGILCSNCNTAIGLFREDTAAIFSAIQYLRAFL